MMKIALQYANDLDGKTQAVQIFISEWEKLPGKQKKDKQTLKLRSDLKKAFEQVSELKNQKGHKQTLNEFLNALSIPASRLV